MLIKKIIKSRYFSHFLLVLLCISIGGCGTSTLSTSFKPPNDHKVYLALKDGGLSFIKDGVVVTLEEVHTLFDCDSVAQSFAKKGVELIKSGARWYHVFGIGRNKIHSGVASLIDAMNIHNDQGACVSPSQLMVEDLTIPPTIEITYGSTVEILNAKVHIKCLKKRESLFFSTISLSFEGVTGIDKNRDGSFTKTSLKVEKGDKFFIKAKSLLLHVEVIQETEDGVTIALEKQ